MHHQHHINTLILVLSKAGNLQPTGNWQRATAPQLFYYKLEICLKCARFECTAWRWLWERRLSGEWGVGSAVGEGELKVARVMRNLHTTKLQIR